MSDQAPLTEQTRLRVVRGNPTDEELAAVVAVVTAAATSAPAPGPPVSKWADKALLLRQLPQR